MPRKQSDTAIFFPHYAKSGKTIFILESHYKNEGYAFWFKLLELLTSTEGHFLDLNNIPDWQYLMAKTLTDETTAKSIMDLLAELQAIDADLWKIKIVWVQNLVNNLEPVYRNRKRELPTKPQNPQLNINTICGKMNIAETPISTSRNAKDATVSTVDNTAQPDNYSVSTQKSTQSRVEYSREENSKVDIVGKTNGFHEIFDYWNSQEIIVHQKITDKMETAIRATLRDYSLEQIKTAINNYSQIINSPLYYFNYKWTLEDFLRRGADKFLDLEIAQHNYLKKPIDDKNVKPVINKNVWRVR